MSFNELALSGAKGGSGGGGTYRNRPDNLRSTDTFEAVLGLGSGRIRLAPGGLKNLFVDDVAVEDGQGNSTYKAFAASLFDGDPMILQPISLQLGSSSGMTSVGLSVGNTYDGAPGDWKYAAVTHPGVEFIDLRFIVQQLFNQTKNGIGDETLTLQIELRPSGAADWVNPLTSVAAPTYSENGINRDNLLFYVARSMLTDDGGGNTVWSESSPGGLSVSGKTTSPYIKEIRLAVPNTGAYANKTWEVRCRLVEKDYIVSGNEGENEIRRTVSWESIAGATTTPFGDAEEWRGVSHIQIFGTASDQINGIPEITGIYDLDLYQVPPLSVWNPDTRLYTGTTWDGVTTQLAFTQCPAWQIKGLIEDDLSGISALAPGSTLNKWDALEASKWFAQQVPDGRGGFQPRYSLNWFLDSGMQVGELVNYLAGAVGGAAWDEGDGRWRLKVEKPETPAMIFTKENIIGEIQYQHTDIDTRFNDITAVYRDKDQRYIENRVRVFDQADIDATGRRHTTIVLVGCDNRQEALRRAYIRLLTSLNEKRMASWVTNRLGGLLEPLSVVALADGDLNSNSAIRSTGRIVAKGADFVEVRDTLRLEAGVAYKVHITIPNPDYNPETTSQPTSPDWNKPTINITRNITNSAAQRGDVTKLYIDQALPSSVPEFAVVALEAVGLPALPKQYRVLSITPGDDGETVGITAMEIYTPKWVESDNITEEQLAAQVPSRTCPAPIMPDTGMFKLDTYETDRNTRRILSIIWDRPGGSRYIEGYRVEYRFNGGTWTTLAARTSDNLIELLDPLPGYYEARIVTLDRRGFESLPLESNITLDEVSLYAPTALLTNESHTVATASDGSGGDLATAGGSFQIFNGNGQVLSGVAYSVANELNCDLTIDANGVYTVNSLSADQGIAILRAVWGGFTIEKKYSITKSRAGGAGQPGSSAKLLRLAVDRQIITLAANGAPSPTSQTITFTVNPQNLSSTSFTISVRRSDGTVVPVGSAFNPVSGTLTANGNDVVFNGGTQFTLSADNFNNWRGSTPGIVVTVTHADGFSDKITIVKAQDVAAGANGLNNAVVNLYKRSATTPDKPTNIGNYDFAMTVLSAMDNGWTQGVPSSNGQPLWVISATASSATGSDTIAPNEWSEPTVMAQDGQGGSNGLNVATIMLYKRAVTDPAKPTTSSTFTFATGNLTGHDGGWTQAVPANNDQSLWVTTATASSANATDTIAASEWATPVLMVTNGTNGGNGFSSALVSLYQRAASAPPVPSVTTTYTFGSAVLATPNNGWTSTIPANNGQPLWVTTATALGLSEDTIASNEWAAPVILASNGTNGTNGTNGSNGLNVASVFLYKRQVGTPAKPSVNVTYTFGSGLVTDQNNGWSPTVPANNGQPLWVISATASNTGPTDTLTPSEWSEPSVLAQDGTNGTNGTNGKTGAYNAVVNSDFNQPGDFLYGWRTNNSYNSTGLSVELGINLGGWFGALNVAFAHNFGTPAAGTVFDGHTQGLNGETDFLASLRRWALPVAPGDIVYASALVGAHRCQATVNVTFWDKDGGYISEGNTALGGRNGGGANGDPANFDRLKDAFPTPANAAFATVRIRGWCQGLADPYIFYTQMQLCKMPSGAPFPDYVPGPRDGTTPISFDLSAQAISVAATSGGVTKTGQFPKNSTLIVTQGATNLTAGASVTLTPSSSAIAASYANGVVSITQADALGHLDVTVSYGGSQIGTKRIAISRTLDPMPPASQTSTNQSFTNAVTSTQFASVPDSRTILMTATGNGTLIIDVNYEFRVGNQDNNIQQRMKCKALIRLATFGWGDFGPSVSSSSPAVGGFAEPMVGEGSLYQTFTGLTPGNQYEVGLVFARETTGGSDPQLSCTGLYSLRAE